MNFPKQKNIIVPLEELFAGKWYAVTINPSDKFQHFKDHNRIGKFLNDLDLILFHSGLYKYKLYVELSPKGRLHLHGKIKIKDKIGFYLNAVQHLLARATIVMKEIDDEQKWLEYCTKQYELHNYIKLNHYTEMPLINSTIYNKT